MKKLKIALLSVLFFSSSVSFTLAHTAICSCFDNGDGTITCEGGFSDGSTAEGVRMLVQDSSGVVMSEGEMNEESTCEFKKPKGEYSVVFDGGEGHRIIIDSTDIVE